MVEVVDSIHWSLSTGYQWSSVVSLVQASEHTQPTPLNVSKSTRLMTKTLPIHFHSKSPSTICQTYRSQPEEIRSVDFWTLAIY